MTSFRRLGFAAMAAFLLIACGERAPSIAGRNEGSLVTLVDYFERGEERVARELALGNESKARITVARAAAAAHAVVRLRIHFGFHGETFSTTHATAALIDGGTHAITVGHAAIVAFEQPDARVELVLDDGRVLRVRARPLDHYDPAVPSTDWAVLDVVDPPAGLPALELGRPEPGERIVLGFPGRFGMGAGDRVTIDDPQQSAKLRPLRLLCRAADAHATSLEMIAGAVPIGGFSGAPCIDVAGRVVGIERAVTDSSSGGKLTWTLEVVGLDDLRAELAR